MLLPPDHSSHAAPRPVASTAPRDWPPRSRPPMGARYVGGRRQRGGAALRCGRGVPNGRPAGMGGSESSQGGRKVSFGLDEREQVRVLQGIRVRRCRAAGLDTALLGGTRQPRAGLRPPQRPVRVRCGALRGDLRAERPCAHRRSVSVFLWMPFLGDGHCVCAARRARGLTANAAFCWRSAPMGAALGFFLSIRCSFSLYFCGAELP